MNEYKDVYRNLRSVRYTRIPIEFERGSWWWTWIRRLWGIR